MKGETWLFILMLAVLFVGILDIGNINENVEATLASSVTSVENPASDSYASTMQSIHFIAGIWYAILASILLLVILLMRR